MDAYQHNAHYSRWDGSQQISSLTADEIMRAIADELVDDGDLMRALRQLFREGLETADGERLPGWYDMLQKVRQAKQEQLNRFDMGSIIDDIRARIRDVVETERDGLEQRLEAAEATLAAAEA
ncbi:MAG TPA: VWA domain-containing protein, partial [Thermomicrobiales bacterium]|nr:VWA domain-containing protein [Thermomicrobiales bacterium]